jgi:hypothetical protein
VTVCILAVFVASPNFLPQYFVWVVPFALLAGWWRLLVAVFALELLILPFKYLPVSVVDGLGLGNEGLYHDWVVAAVYVPASFALYGVMLWWLVRWFRQPGAR